MNYFLFYHHGTRNGKSGVGSCNIHSPEPINSMERIREIEIRILESNPDLEWVTIASFQLLR